MGRVAVVTGASGGVGAASARALAADGFDLVVSFASDAEAANRVAAEVGVLGRRAVVVRTDVSEGHDVRALFGASEELGHLSVLVNNAAFAPPASTLVEMGPDRIARTFQANAVGAFLCAREAVARMSSERGGAGGSIVNISSQAAVLGSPGEFVDYAASKAAIESFTIGLAREVGNQGIRVNAVRPGIIDTGFHARTGQPEKAQRLGTSVPLGRAGQPEEVAAAVSWLCSDAASYVNGAILDVTGGR